MEHLTGISRPMVIGLIVLTLTLGGFLLQPAGAVAGSLSRFCSQGEHYQEATLTVR